MIDEKNKNQIIKRWDVALKNCISGIDATYRFKLQKKLELFPLSDKKKREEIETKIERQKSSLIEQKKRQYQRKCDAEIANFDEDIPKKKKKSRAKTHNGQLDKLLTILQKYVRLRDSDHRGIGFCISCGKKTHRKDANGGHYYDRSYKSVCIQLTNINLQCTECNAKQSTGDSKEKIQVRLNYRLGLIKKYGEDVVHVLDQLVLKEKSDPLKYGKIAIYDIDEWILYYTPLVRKMEKEKCDIRSLQPNQTNGEEIKA